MQLDMPYHFASGLHGTHRDKCQQRCLCRGRDEAKARAAEHLRMGNSQAAYECFQKAVDISPAVANRFVQVSPTDRVQCKLPYIQGLCNSQLLHLQACRPAEPPSTNGGI